MLDEGQITMNGKRLLTIETLLSTPGGGGGGSRAIARCDYLSRWPFSDSRTSLFRPYLGSGHEATSEKIMLWMRQSGISADIDTAGNVVGRYEGTIPNAPALLIGPHIDRVKNAGSYDEMRGVMLGLELVDKFNKEGVRFDFAIEVIGFGDEEGSRFPSYMLGSRAVAGSLPEGALDARDVNGTSLAKALAQWNLDVTLFAQARRKPGAILGYLEAHIEQATSLEDIDRPLGLVSSIAAQSRHYITVDGVSAHAGTAMEKRHDALTAASDMILVIEAIATAGPEDLVATCGAFTSNVGEATNIVAGHVQFSLDLRAADVATHKQAGEKIISQLTQIAAQRCVTVSIDKRDQLTGAQFDKHLNQCLERAIMETLNYRAPYIVSQAGHDAMNIAALAPVAMLFIRCKEGISHNPDEAVAVQDVIAALDVMHQFVRTFAH